MSKSNMIKSKKRKISKRKDTDDDLTPKEWQARHDAACTIVARKYCDMFKFWLDCRYKPCRSARRCIGDARDCLDLRWPTVPHEVDAAAHAKMPSEIPPGADRYLCGVHHWAPHAVGKANSKLRESRSKNRNGAHADAETRS